jgi:hypothetical protein
MPLKLLANCLNQSLITAFGFFRILRLDHHAKYGLGAGRANQHAATP